MKILPESGEPAAYPEARVMRPGDLFRTNDSQVVYLAVHPSLVEDMKAKVFQGERSASYVFAVRCDDGKLWAIPPSTAVTPLSVRIVDDLSSTRHTIEGL